LSAVERCVVLFDSPHLGIRGAGLFASIGKVELTDDFSRVNVSVVASPDVATVVTKCSIQPGECLVALNPLRRTRENTDARLVIENLNVDNARENWQEWLRELVAAVNDLVFSKGLCCWC
jgi:hypothetical protein